MGLARNYTEGVHPPALDPNGGLQQGQVTVFSTPAASGDPQVALPSGAAPQLQPFYGVNDTAGTVGGPGTRAGEALSLCRQGLWRALLTHGLVSVRGGQLIADASVLGNVAPRVPYSTSAVVMGTAEEAYGPSATDDAIEVYVQPYVVEVIREMFASGVVGGAIGAATKFLAGQNLALSSTVIALYRARFAGETLRNLGVTLLTAPGGVDTVTVTFQKSSDNGATWTDITGAGTPSVVIAGAAKAGADLVNSFALAAGDLVGVKLVSTAATAACPIVGFDIT